MLKASVLNEKLLNPQRNPKCCRLQNPETPRSGSPTEDAWGVHEQTAPQAWRAKGILGMTSLKP